MRSLFAGLVLAFATAVSAVSTTGNRLLVVLDDVTEKTAYTSFFGDLSGRGYDITYETPRSEQLSLFRHGEKKYDHILFLPTKVKGLGPNLTPNLLVDFVNAEGNVLIAQSSTHTTSTSLAGFLTQLDIHLPYERTGLVVDHFSYDTVSAPEKHNVLVLDSPQPIRAGVKPLFSLPEGDVLAFPNTVGHALGPGQLLSPILRAPKTAYSYSPKEQAEVIEADDLFGAGSQLNLVSAFQARNSARVVLLGSAEMLEDKWFGAKVARPDAKKTPAANREFAKRLSAFTFQELGVLRVNSVEHREVGSNETNPEMYRVKNEATFAISISEYSYDSWTSFDLDPADELQLEFSMLSPFHRLNLAPITKTPDATVFGTTFTLPDQHGIFNFRVNYKRPFLTYIDEKHTVSVRHIAHDEWPRSFAISGAWPWISGIGATVVGWLAFCAVWMYGKTAPVPAAGKKKQ
jgi:oligosaccharyltransferase complex subunit beta